MKRGLVLGLLAALAIGGCQKVETKDVVPGGKVFTATMETMAGDAIDTKTSMDADGNVLWKRGDQVSIFVASTINQQFQVTDASDGKTATALNPVGNAGSVSGEQISNNVAFYPYASTAAIAQSGGSYVISDIALPATQNYADASFGNGAFPMAAVTNSASDYNLKFKNVLGGLKLQLTGMATIASISVTGNNDDILCGAASVTVSTTTVPAITLNDASAKTVTLDCGNGVQLDAATATAFIIALPPMTMASGFTVTVTDTENKSMEIKTTRSQSITRSNLLAMPAVNYVGVAPLPDGAVDLGLPSGLLWASCNLSVDGFVSSPEEFGDYYAWGETAPYYASGHAYDGTCVYWKSGKTAGYAWASYKWCNGSSTTLTRYCTNVSFGTVDNKTEFRDYGYDDDAARQTLGDNWRIPTDAEWSELITECSWIETNMNGVYGKTVTGPNRNSIFLPYAGCRWNINLDAAGSYGDYWSSTVSADTPYCAWVVSFGASGVSLSDEYNDRWLGQSIRPVYSIMDSQER